MYQAGGNPADYLDVLTAVLGDQAPAVRDMINAGKSWGAVPKLSAAKPPPAGGAKGLETGGDFALAGPSTGGGRGLDEPSPTPVQPGPVQVQRSANVYFPKTVQLSQKMIPLIVHIAREQAEQTVKIQQGSSGLSLTVGDMKIFVLTADFTVERAIGGREIEDVEYGRIVRVSPEADSEPLVFFLSPTSAGEKRISIEFKQSGKRIGSLAFDVAVIEEAVPATRLAGVMDGQPPFLVSAAGTTGAAPIAVPDLDLRVLVEGKTLSYVLSSADGKYDEKKLGSKVLLIDPAPFFANITQQLSDLAARRPEYRTGDDKALPGQLGAQLWDQLASDELRQVYKDDLRVNYSGKSLKITTDEPWIPWEMLRPVELENGAFVVDDSPLCETFRLTRWLDGRGAPERVQVKRGVIVAPPRTRCRPCKTN